MYWSPIRIKIRKAEPRFKIKLLLSFPIAEKPTPGESVGVKLKRYVMIASVGNTLKSAMFAKFVITITTLPGICRFNTWNEMMICWAFTKDHIEAIEPDNNIWTPMFAITEDWPKFLMLSVAASTLSITSPRITCGGKILIYFLKGFFGSAPEAKD